MPLLVLSSIGWISASAEPSFDDEAGKASGVDQAHRSKHSSGSEMSSMGLRVATIMEIQGKQHRSPL